MLRIVLDLIANLALLVALSVLSGFIRQRWERGRSGAALQGLLFGVSAVFGMVRPLVLAPGLIYDGRSVVLSLCALFFGPLAGGNAGGLAIAYRLFLGGMGAPVGVSVILSAVGLGLLFRHLAFLKRQELSWRWFLGLGLAVHAAMLGIMLWLPGGAGPSVLRQIGLPVMLTYPAVTLVIGKLLADQAAERRAMEALSQAQRTLVEFVRHSPIHVYIKEVGPTESRVMVASDNFVEMVGIPADDMIGRSMAELFPPAFAEKMTADDWAVVSSGRILKLDEELNNRYYTTIKFPIRVGERWLLAGYTIDITEQKQAERTLAEKEASLRTLVNTIPDLIWLKDAEGVYLSCNPMFERFFGAREADIVGRTDYDFVPKELADLFRANDRRAMEAGGPVRNEETITFADDGHQAILETTKTPMFDLEGRLVGVLGIGHDISARKRMAAERRQLESQLVQAQKMESMGSLAGGVAHDMNNVLGAIMGLASASLESQPEGSPAYRAFDTILKASERGGKMVRSLLSFARQSLAEERELDLNALLHDEVSLLERTTLARVRLELDLAPDLRPMRGDANALTHALMNLCVNAVDAMPEGGLLILRTRNVDREWIEVQVEDSGSGMPQEVLEKAMDPFFTTKAQGKGTGLGLSLVYSTVKAHRGQVELRSELGRGTCVHLRFPASEPEQLREAASESASLPPAVQGLEVLLVDDDELVRSSVLVLLGLLGHTATAVSCGEEALQKLEDGLRADVVILDMNMPGLGGAGTLPRLRALRPRLPVLLATGRADQGALDLVQAHPGVTLLSKPFGMAELRGLLGAIPCTRGIPS